MKFQNAKALALGKTTGTGESWCGWHKWKWISSALENDEEREAAESLGEGKG